MVSLCSVHSVPVRSFRAELLAIGTLNMAGVHSSEGRGCVCGGEPRLHRVFRLRSPTEGEFTDKNREEVNQRTMVHSQELSVSLTWLVACLDRQKRLFMG